MRNTAARGQSLEPSVERGNLRMETSWSYMAFGVLTRNPIFKLCVGLHDPMQMSRLIFHDVAQISIEQNVVSNTSGWLDVVWEIDFGRDRASCTIATEQVAGSNLETMPEHFVDDGGNAAFRILLEIMKRGVEQTGGTIGSRIADQYRL
jgi:hypothetical protein